MGTSCYVRQFGQYISGYFLQNMWIILTLMHKLGVPIQCKYDINTDVQ